MTTTLTRTFFVLEPLESQQFEGVTDGESWNGWACPYFTKSEADRIVAAWQSLGYKADYDAETDLYRFAPIDRFADADPDLSDEELAEHFGPVTVDGQTLYAIGTGAWVWEEAPAVPADQR